MNKKIFMSLIFLLSLQVLAQGPDILWTKTFGGLEKDRGSSVHQTSDNGYIIAGYTESFGVSDPKLWLIKTDSLGNIIWDKTYGNASTIIDPNPQFSVTQTIDNGFIICGYKASIAPEGYGWLLKTDVNGDTLWTREFPAYPGSRLFSVKETFDSGYVATGYRSEGTVGGFEDIYLVKTNSSGGLIWTKTYGSSIGDVGTCVETTLDGGYVVVGSLATSYNFDANIVLLKTDGFGDTVWTKLFGGDQGEIGYAVQKTNDGGYVLVGSTNSFGIFRRIWLLKTNALGDTLWTRTYGGYGDYDGYSVQQSCDGGYVITGKYYHPTGGSDLIIIKADENGNQIWYNNLGSGMGRSIQQTTDLGYIIGGSIFNNQSMDDVWLVKTKPLTVMRPNGWEIYTVGDTISISWISECIADVSIKLSYNNGLTWNSIIDSTANSGDYTWVVSAADSTDQCLIKITDYSDSTKSDVSNNTFTIDLVSSIENPISNEYPKEYLLAQNYPNPFNPSTKISWQVPVGSWQTLKIYDVLGNEIITLVDEYKPAGNYEIEFNSHSSEGRNLKSGVYFYQLKAENYIETKKMILLK
jgi:hypothetical protein